MVSTYARSETALRLYGLPGAVLEGRLPELRDGQLVITPTTYEAPVPSFLIEHRRGLVLFDTGLNPQGADNLSFFDPVTQRIRILRFGRDDVVDAQIRAAGFRPQDIKYVVPSHLHWDHGGGVRLFPDATVIVGAGEISAAYWPPATGYLVDDLLTTRAYNWLEISSDLDLFGDGSVVILLTPGHTRGELSMLVRLPSRTILLTGDTCHFCLEFDHVMKVTGIGAFDPVQAVQSIRRLRVLSRTLPSEIWVSHDAGHWAQFPHSPEAIS